MAAKNVAAPRLPAAPVEYDARFMDAFTNILRQYFNALDNPGPLVASTQRFSATNIVTALSCAMPGSVPGSTVISLPTQADFANLKSGDIYYDTSGGTATSYPLRIKA